MVKAKVSRDIDKGCIKRVVNIIKVEIKEEVMIHMKETEEGNKDKEVENIEVIVKEAFINKLFREVILLAIKVIKFIRRRIVLMK